MLKGLRWILWILLGFTLLVALGWAALALWFDSQYPLLFVSLFLLVACGSILLLQRWAQKFLLLTGLLTAVLLWWFNIAPSHDRNWQEDVSRLPSAEVEGDKLTVHNLRNFEYRSETDFTPHWEERTFDLSQLEGADLFMSDWGATGIVHTIASWDFGDGPSLAISIETRKEVGEEYSAIKGFFRQYELYYVVADERDVIGVRANHRGEKVHLYRIRMQVPVARELLLSYFERINQLAVRPAWYNALTANCTTTIRMHVQSIGRGRALNWRHFANKYGDELLYMRGQVNTSIPFQELQERSDVTAAIQAAGNNPNFSKLIRRNLPER